MTDQSTQMLEQVAKAAAEAKEQSTGKTVLSTVKAFQGLALGSLANAVRYTQRNDERFHRGLEAFAAKKQGIKVDDMARKPGEGIDDMRVDSDNFYVKVYEAPKEAPKASKGGWLLPLAVTVASIAFPLFGVAWQAPAIIKALWPNTSVEKPAEVPVAPPANTGATKPFTDSVMIYDITTG